MAKNLALKRALVNKKILGAADPVIRSKALDDILQADPTDINAVRTAIINNKGFWQLFPELQETAANKFYTDSDLLLTLDGPPALSALRQAAAEQRVSLGLKDAPDDVLVNIMSNNPDECRAYMASRQQLGIADPEIQPPLLPGNTTTDLLSNAAVIRIQTQSRDLLLSRLIEKTENKNFLVQLLTANDRSTLEAAASNLGYPQELNDKLTPLNGAVKGVIKQRITVLNQIAGKEIFKTHAESLSTDALLNQKSLLESTNRNFKNRLPPQIRIGLSDQDVNWAKGVLGARYLQAFLAKTKDNVLPAINATNDDELKVQLKVMAGIGNHDYIDHAVNGNLDVLRKAMLHGHISNKMDDHDVLKKLDKTENLKKFREALVNAGITSVDWIEESDLNEMKQWIRSRLFESQLDLVSQLGAAPHAQLVKVFAGLPIEKQRSILNDPTHHYQLLNAKEVNVLESYLGKDTAGLDEVVAENKRLADFQQIQNAAVAKVLVNFKSEINLNPNQINEINKELRDAVSAGTDFNNPANYKTLIDKIKPHCDSVNPGHFYEAFGLNNDGLSFKADSSARAAIIKQNTHNLSIVPAFTMLSDKDPNKKLLGVFLTLDKKEDLNPNVIKDKFKTAKTYKEFIEGVVPANNAALRAQLSSQLSSSMFYELKVAEVNKKILSRSSREFNEGITAVNEELKSVQKHHETSTKSMKHFKFIEGIEPYHLYNPTFRGEARRKAAEMKDKYQSISHDCDLIVDQLRRDQRKLENFFNLRGSLDPSLPKADKDKLGVINQKLNKELAVIKSDLQYYEKIQQKLSGTNGILPAITDAADNKKAHVFQAEGVTRKFVSREEVASLTYTSTAASRSRTGLTPGEAEGKQQFELLGYVVPPGKIEAIDVVKTEYQQDGVTKAHETAGRYTIDRTPPVPASKSSPINKTPSPKVEIHEFPKQTIPAPRAGSPEDVKLKQARIEFALTVAAEAIALLDRPPTKAKPLCLYGSNAAEMRYLWTALIILGEKNPNMKFGADAIKLERFGSNDFDPAKEKKDKFLGFDQGYKDESLYNQFKSEAHQPEVERKSAAVNKMSDEKMRLFSQRSKVDPQAIEAAAALKKSNMDFRKQAKQTKDVEEPVVKQDTGLNNA
jgi:hypothetical protein